MMTGNTSSPQTRSELAILNAKVQKLQERIEALEAEARKAKEGQLVAEGGG
jgi:cell division protein FtsB